MKLQLQPTMKTNILCASIAGLLTTAANAANVTWQAPGTISGAADVSTAGTLYGSWAPGDVHNPDVLPVKDRKSTRLNSSLRCISHAVFCLINQMTIRDISLKIDCLCYSASPGRFRFIR